MRFQETPPENERTRADRLSDVPPIFWTLLAIVAVVVFGAILLFLFRHHA